tara:strand:- start:40 stop:255 length:216 start_codon:yes stop_codon:yes gene_type:complete
MQTFTVFVRFNGRVHPAPVATSIVDVSAALDYLQMLEFLLPGPRWKPVMIEPNLEGSQGVYQSRSRLTPRG